MKPKILFPEIEDPRVIEAVATLQELGFCIPHTLDDFEEIVSTEILATHYFEKRKSHGKEITHADALQKMDSALYRAATLVSMGYADACIAGSMSPSEDIIRAGIQAVGIADDTEIVSSYFVFEYTDKILAFADCAVVQNPTAPQLAAIAIATATNYQKYTGSVPKIAMLSYSTHGSGGGEVVTKMQQATALVREKIAETDTLNNRMSHWLIDGEIQFDAAFDVNVAHIKTPQSALQGAANVFIFPDLSSGNIAYKIAERMGGATAIGPVLQGITKPFMDLSRGCSARDIVKMAKLVTQNLTYEMKSASAPTPSPSHAASHQINPLAL